MTKPLVKKPSRELRPAAVAFQQAGLERIIRRLEHAREQGMAPRRLGPVSPMSLKPTQDMKPAQDKDQPIIPR